MIMVKSSWLVNSQWKSTDGPMDKLMNGPILSLQSVVSQKDLVMNLWKCESSSASLKMLILQTFDEALKEHNGSVAANNEAKTPQ